MTVADLDTFREWFAAFCREHYMHDPADQRNILLKEEHSANVCANVLAIAEEEGLDEADRNIAEAIALFHDVGRFPQYRRYRTFLDSKSENHGLLGAATLVENGILLCLPYEEQRFILESVRFHNAFAIPRDADERLRRFLGLVRDADKLDIWRIFIDFYEAPPGERAEAAGLGLPDTPGYSSGLLAFFEKREVVALQRLENLNDFKLLQLTWVFDLNFAASFRMLIERGYIGRIAATLPKDDTMQRIAADVRDYAGGRAR